MTRRSFRVRTGAGGTQLREDGLPEDSGLRADGYVNLPDTPLEGYLSVTPETYSSVRVDWNIDPDTDWLQAVIVWSTTGEPSTVLDGRRIASFTPDDALFSFTSPAFGGAWHYYSLFILITDGFTEWYERLLTDYTLVPTDWGSTEMLWRRIPQFYRLRDIELGSGDDLTGPLYRFLNTLGWEIDYTRTLINTLTLLNRPLYTVSHALRELGKLLGAQQDVGDLGTSRYRFLVDNLMHLRRYKGTLDGVKKYLNVVSGYKATVEEISATEVDIKMHVQRVNFIKNPKFEAGVDGLDDWTPTAAGGVTDTVTDNVLIVENTNGSVADYTLESNTFPIDDQSEYVVSFRLDELPQMGQFLVIFWWDGVAPVSPAWRIEPVEGSTSQLRVVTDPLPPDPGTTEAFIWIFMNDIEAGGFVKLTQVVVEIGTSGEYFDGDTIIGGVLPGGGGDADFRWSGAANASFSYYNLDYGRTKVIVENLFPYILPVGHEVGVGGAGISDWSYYPGKP